MRVLYPDLLPLVVLKQRATDASLVAILCVSLLLVRLDVY